MSCSFRSTGSLDIKDALAKRNNLESLTSDIMKTVEETMNIDENIKENVRKLRRSRLLLDHRDTRLKYASKSDSWRRLQDIVAFRLTDELHARRKIPGSVYDLHPSNLLNLPIFSRRKYQISS